MKTTIKPTGYAPIEIDHIRSFTATQMLEGDKRGVSVTLYELTPGTWAGEVCYLSTWGNERNFTTYVQPVFDTSLTVLAENLRTKSKDMLPPGAGFPATPSFETRQAKLKGMLETLTLVALSDVLEQAQRTPP